jgi:hypothetical protein
VVEGVVGRARDDGLVVGQAVLLEGLVGVGPQAELLEGLVAHLLPVLGDRVEVDGGEPADDGLEDVRGMDANSSAMMMLARWPRILVPSPRGRATMMLSPIRRVHRSTSRRGPFRLSDPTMSRRTGAVLPQLLAVVEDDLGLAEGGPADDDFRALVEQGPEHGVDGQDERLAHAPAADEHGEGAAPELPEDGNLEGGEGLVEQGLAGEPEVLRPAHQVEDEDVRVLDVVPASLGEGVDDFNLGGVAQVQPPVLLVLLQPLAGEVSGEAGREGVRQRLRGPGHVRALA